MGAVSFKVGRPCQSGNISMVLVPQTSIQSFPRTLLSCGCFRACFSVREGVARAPGDRIKTFMFAARVIVHDADYIWLPITFTIYVHFFISKYFLIT